MNISVVIPAYNVAAYIREALNSVLEQEVAVSEIVIVDDASVDETEVVVQSVASSQSEIPIRLLKNSQNRGVSFTRNRGIAKASGEWIAFLDPDDRWFPNHIRLSAEALESGADFSYGWLEEFGDESRMALGVIRPSRWERLTWPTSYYRRQFIYPSALCARKNRLVALGGFADYAHIGEDWILMVRAILREMIVVEIPHVTCAMRKHADSATANKVQAFQRWWDDCQPVLDEYPLLRKYRTAEFFRQRGYWEAHRHPLKAAGWYLRAIGQDPLRFGLWLRLGLLVPMFAHLEFLIPRALRFHTPPQTRRD